MGAMAIAADAAGSVFTAARPRPLLESQQAAGKGSKQAQLIGPAVGLGLQPLSAAPELRRPPISHMCMENKGNSSDRRKTRRSK